MIPRMADLSFRGTRCSLPYIFELHCGVRKNKNYFSLDFSLVGATVWLKYMTQSKTRHDLCELLKAVNAWSWRQTGSIQGKL